MMFDRSTIVSTSVYNILQSATHPLSVQMILNELNKQSIIPNKATVYRILKKLKDKNAINEFSVRNGGSFLKLQNTIIIILYAMNAMSPIAYQDATWKPRK